MKTLFIAHDLFSAEGGIARILRTYLRAQCEMSVPGDEVHYVAYNDGYETITRARTYAGERLNGVDACNGSKWAFVQKVLTRGRKSDLIICGHLHHLILCQIAAIIRPGLKYYLIAHGIEVWRPYKVLELVALRGAHRILCVSEYTRRQILRFEPALDPTRLTVVPNTIDAAFKIDGHAGVRPVDGRHPIILVVSRLVATDPYKGVDTMIEAMPQVMRQFPTAQLRIIGGGDDQSRLEAIAVSLGLGNAVHFTGVIDDFVLRQEYVACDVFALPSRKEGFGLVYLEAMTYGKPCLAARAGGAPEVVNKEVGALVEYGNTDQIAVAVADLVRHPRDRGAVLRRASEFGFPVFKQRLAAALSD